MPISGGGVPPFSNWQALDIVLTAGATYVLDEGINYIQPVTNAFASLDWSAAGAHLEVYADGAWRDFRTRGAAASSTNKPANALSDGANIRVANASGSTIRFIGIRNF